MSAPRVPPGWTREAADLVWEDWEGRLLGSRHAVETDSEGYGRPDGAPALRAWAAVGAPVLAPAEDGRPSLAEWVAAACSSALGEPAQTWPEDDELRLGFQWGPFPRYAHGKALGYIAVILSADGATVMVNGFVDPLPTSYATPAALRAALDALAVRT